MTRVRAKSRQPCARVSRPFGSFKLFYYCRLLDWVTVDNVYDDYEDLRKREQTHTHYGKCCRKSSGGLGGYRDCA